MGRPGRRSAAKRHARQVGDSTAAVDCSSHGRIVSWNWGSRHVLFRYFFCYRIVFHVQVKQRHLIIAQPVWPEHRRPSVGLSVRPSAEVDAGAAVSPGASYVAQWRCPTPTRATTAPLQQQWDRQNTYRGGVRTAVETKTQVLSMILICVFEGSHFTGMKYKLYHKGHRNKPLKQQRAVTTNTKINSGSASPVLRATGFVNGKGQFSTP